MAKYTGWKQIGGKWYYFNGDYTLALGLITCGGRTGCTEVVYDYDTGEFAVTPATNCYRIFGIRTYYFDGAGTGSLQTGSGWRSANGKWHYLENGNLITNTYRVIDGAGYYFDDEGLMITNDVAYVESIGSYRFFGAGGAVRTTAGWYQSGRGWHYILADGTAIAFGIYQIDGQVYSFAGGVMCT